MNLYDFTVRNGSGEDICLKQYQGKVVLVINSATGCGFTPQYEPLQALYAKYADQGFVILDFPCNQFGNQAPGSDHEIATFCTGRFGVTFPIFSKIEVNGQGQSPLFGWLKSQAGFEGFGEGHPLTAIMNQVAAQMDPDFAHNSDIKWNFTKFLLDREGNVVRRYEPTADIGLIEKSVKELL